LTTPGGLVDVGLVDVRLPPVDPGTDDRRVMFDVEHRNDLAPCRVGRYVGTMGSPASDRTGSAASLTRPASTA